MIPTTRSASCKGTKLCDGLLDPPPKIVDVLIKGYAGFLLDLRIVVDAADVKDIELGVERAGQIGRSGHERLAHS